MKRGCFEGGCLKIFLRSKILLSKYTKSLQGQTNCLTPGLVGGPLICRENDYKCDYKPGRFCCGWGEFGED